MAETLYSPNGGYPVVCPQAGSEPDGTMWTDLPHNPEGRAALGLVAAPQQPPFDAATEWLDWIDGEWVVVDLAPVPAEPLDQVRAAARAKVAADRWAATQTFEYDGVSASPADPAIGVITAKLMLMQMTQAPAETTFTWKLGDGEFRTWTQADLLAYGAAIGEYIQGCFDLELAANAVIDDPDSDRGTIVAASNLDWPS